VKSPGCVQSDRCADAPEAPLLALRCCPLLLRQKTAILTTIGVLEEPLGNARLHGSRLIAALLHTNTPSINQELCRLSTMDLLLVSSTV